MFSESQIQQAMRSAMAAGDTEAVADLRQRLTEAYQASAPKATEGMSGGQKFLAGVGQGMTNIGRQAANIVGLKSDESLQDAAGLDRALLDTGAGKAGSIVGEIAATAPLGGLAAGGARAVGAGAIRAGLAEGALQGGLTAGPGSRLGGAAQGAAFGAVLPGAGAALRRVATPLKSTENARKLLRANVNLTPGELNPSGKLNQWEQALQSGAIGGSAIREARDESMRDFQRAVANRAQAPGAPRIGRGVKDVNDMAAQTQQGFNAAYDNSVTGYNAMQPSIVRTAGGDIPLKSYPQQRGVFEQAARQNYPGRHVTPSMRKDLSRSLQDQLGALPKSGNVTAKQLQDLRSAVRTMARDTDVGGERAILRGASEGVTAALKSQMQPDDFARLSKIDEAYPDFKILQDVTKRGGDQPGGWTPAQLSQSVRSATDLGDYATGGGRLRDLSKAGREVFEQRSMPTGERQVTTSFLGRLGLPAAGLISVAGTKVSGKKLAGETAKQRALRAALRRTGKKHATDLRYGSALGTAGMIQANQE
jgi:cytochrome c5